MIRLHYDIDQHVKNCKEEVVEPSHLLEALFLKKERSTRFKKKVTEVQTVVSSGKERCIIKRERVQGESGKRRREKMMEKK